MGDEMMFYGPADTDLADEPAPIQRPPEPGHAIAFIGDRTLLDLLQVPAGIEVRGVYFDPVRGQFAIHFTGEGLPPCPAYEEPARGHIRLSYVHDSHSSTKLARLQFVPPADDTPNL